MSRRQTSIAVPICLLSATLALLSGSPALAKPTAAPPVCAPWCVQMLSPTTEEGGSPVSLELLRVDYDVDILGSVAVGTLVQEFRNNSREKVDATYAAHRPAGLGINTVGIGTDREELEQAPATEPKQPTRSGNRTGRTPTPSAGIVALGRNVEPGEIVTVEVNFQAYLPIEDGHYRLTLPAVKLEGSQAPVPTGYRLFVHHDEPLVEAESDTHDIYADFEGDGTLIELASGDDVEGRDLDLRFSLGSEEEPTVKGFAGPETDGVRDVVVVFTPTVEPQADAVRPKEVLFVLDTSGSMSKGKLTQARVALAECFEKLGPDDRYNVIAFKDSFSMMSETPVDASEFTPAQASGWLDRLRPMGNTKLLPALSATLEQPRDEDHHRMIIVLSDGIVSDERQVIELLERELGEGRLFVVGIGSDVRVPTVEKIAAFGRGAAVFANDPAGLDAVVAGLFGSVSQPLAWDLEVEWGGAEVVEMTPRRLPDLYGGRPVTIFARIKGELPSQMTIQAETMDGPQSYSTGVVVSDGETGPRIPARPRSATQGQRGAGSRPASRR